MYNYQETQLQHHGVKGMKWGVRKARKESNMLRKMALRSTDPDTMKQLNDRATQKSTEADRLEKQAKQAALKRKVAVGLAATTAALAAIAMYRMGEDKRRDAQAKKLNERIKKKTAKELAWLAKKESRTKTNDSVWGTVGDARWNSFGSQFSQKASRGASIVTNLLASKSSAGPIDLGGGTEFYQ